MLTDTIEITKRFRTEPITVQTNLGPQCVQAKVCGPLAYHHNISGKGWHVTHVESGMFLRGAMTSEQQCRTLIKLALESDVDWGGDLNTWTARTKETAQRRAVMSLHHQWLAAGIL